MLIVAKLEVSLNYYFFGPEKDSCQTLSRKTETTHMDQTVIEAPALNPTLKSDWLIRLLYSIPHSSWSFVCLFTFFSHSDFFYRHFIAHSSFLFSLLGVQARSAENQL